VPDNHRRKILIRGVNWIGDAVLTLPAIRAIRLAYPGAYTVLLVKPWVSEIFHNNPDIDEIILYDESFRGLVGKLKLAKILRRKNLDTAILLQNAFDAALIAWLAGIPERIGYNRDGRGFLLTKPIPVKKDILSRHHVHYYLDLLRSAAIKAEETPPYIFLTDDERQRARDVIKSEIRNPESEIIIGINPGATYGSAKRLPAGKFAGVISRIVDELDGKVIIFGSKSEVVIADEIVKSIRANSRSLLQNNVLNVAGRTTLRELSALIAECDALITNDSGPMHIASALFVPVVAVFGSTDKAATGPFGEGHRVVTKGLPCSPCMKRECPEGHLRCMSEITADELFEALAEILPKEKAVFLDRDGTVIEDKNYLNSFDDLVVFPDSKESLQRLKNAGFKLIGVTNQSGIARGIVDENFVIDLNSSLQKEFGIDDFFYCPHHPDEHCPCRKPEPMMALMARLKHRINLKASYVIGDKELDVQLAHKIGSTGILLSSSIPAETRASYVAQGLTDAVRWILEREREKVKQV